MLSGPRDYAFQINFPARMFHRPRTHASPRRAKTVKTVIAKSGDAARFTNDPEFLTRPEDRLADDQRKAFQVLDGTRGTWTVSLDRVARS